MGKNRKKIGWNGKNWAKIGKKRVKDRKKQGETEKKFTENCGNGEKIV